MGGCNNVRPTISPLSHEGHFPQPPTADSLWLSDIFGGCLTPGPTSYKGSLQAMTDQYSIKSLDPLFQLMTAPELSMGLAKDLARASLQLNLSFCLNPLPFPPFTPVLIQEHSIINVLLSDSEPTPGNPVMILINIILLLCSGTYDKLSPSSSHLTPAGLLLGKAG